MEICIKNPLNSDEHYSYNFFSLSAQKDDSFVSSPGLTSPIYLISSLVQSVKDFLYAFKTHDKEQIIEHLIRIFNLPFGIASGLERIISLFLLFITGITVAVLATEAAIFGFIFLGVELGLEIARLIRALTFDSNYHVRKVHNLLEALDAAESISAFIEKHETELKQIVPEVTNFYTSTKTLQKHLIEKVLRPIYDDHFTLTPSEIEELRAKALRTHTSVTSHTKLKLQMKIDFLARRVRPWAAKEIYTLTPSILNSLNHKSGIVQGKELIALMNTQTNKTLLVHVLGITAISLAAISLVFSFILFPFSIPLSIGLVGTAVEFTRFFAPVAFLDQRGWHWSITSCLPQCLQPKKPTEEASSAIEMEELHRH